MSHILYKYLDITGAKYMIGATKPLTQPNLQFTNASQLNDPFDCHPNLVDFSGIPESERRGIPQDWYIKKEKIDALNLRNDTWLCSLSKVNDSLLMWSHYCWNHSGVCIGMDLDKIMANVPGMGVSVIYINPLVFEVQYQDILIRPNKYHSHVDAWHYQLSTKAKEWEYEQEVRLIIEKPNPQLAAYTPEQAKEAKKNRHKLWDWKEIHHYMELSGDCFDSIYFGVKIDPSEKDKIINFARTQLNPDIKLFQMNIDENAFRLKAELITE
jgi:hypothetical protein